LRSLPNTIQTTIRRCRLPGLGSNPYEWLMREAENARDRIQKELNENSRGEALDFVKHLENPFIQVKGD